MPVKLQRGETLEGAVQRAGVAPAEAQRAVEMLSHAMDTVHIKAGLLMPSLPEMSRFWSAMESALGNITQGRQKPKEALDGAAQRIKAP